MGSLPHLILKIDTYTWCNIIKPNYTVRLLPERGIKTESQKWKERENCDEPESLIVKINRTSIRVREGRTRGCSLDLSLC